MSYATIYKVPKSGGIENYREFPNAFRGAALLWTYLSQRYLGLGGMPLRDEDTKRLWALATDERLSEDARIALQTTFDGAMVRRADFERVATAFDALGQMMDAETRDVVARAGDLEQGGAAVLIPSVEGGAP